jgi:Mg/Co/Ni transporter MgtE
METTILVLAGKKWKVPRVLKRTLQIAVSVGLTLLVVLFVQVGGSLLAGRASSLQTATADWLAFIKRPEILTIMTLTALVTVLFVNWQRGQERK